MAKALRAPSDRALNRLIIGSILVLVIGIPGVGIVYFLDQYADPGPSLIERQLASTEDAARKSPNSIGLRLQLASVYTAAERLDAALKQYEEILKVDAGNRAALLGRGDVLVAKGDLGGAAKSYQQIVSASSGEEFAAVDPQLEEAYYGLGSIALKQDRAQDAVGLLETATKIDPADADAWYLLGTANLKIGAADRAVQALRRAVTFVPTGWCEPYARLADAYKTLAQTAASEYAGAMVDFCEKRPVQARQRLEQLTSGSIAVDARLGLGMLAEAEGDTDAAVAWYRGVLALDSKNFNALSGLSRLGAMPPSDQPHPSISAPAAGGNG